VAKKNISAITVTALTSQFPILPLKFVQLANVRNKLVVVIVGASVAEQVRLSQPKKALSVVISKTPQFDIFKIFFLSPALLNLNPGNVPVILIE
jgi:hypothetical protein